MLSQARFSEFARSGDLPQRTRERIALAVDSLVPETPIQAAALLRLDALYSNLAFGCQRFATFSHRLHSEDERAQLTVELAAFAAHLRDSPHLK